MPEKLQSISKPNFSALTPAQVRVSSVVEIGAKYLSKLPDLIEGCCEACQHCQCCEVCEKDGSCQSCQTSYTALFLAKEIGIENLSAGPVKVARDVVYELIQEADMNHGECEITQSRVIVEMPQQAYDQMPGKERFVEIGTTETGAKQYLLRGTSPKKIK